MKVYKLEVKCTNSSKNTVQADDGEYYDCDFGFLYVAAKNVAEATSWVNNKLISVEVMGDCKVMR